MTPVGGQNVIVRAPSWNGLTRLVRDRPVTAVLLDVEAMGSDASGRSSLDVLKGCFPSLPVMVVINTAPDPNHLLLVGRHPTVRVLMGAQLRVPGMMDGLMQGEFRTGPRRIPVLLGQMLPRWPRLALFKAVDAVDRGWSADDFAAAMGVRRPCLSGRLREVGLPSAGSLLTWVKLFYAAWWLQDPGRTAGSIASQLEYSSSQALVRVVRRRLGVTPRELNSRGGLSWAWLRFLRAHPVLAGPQFGAVRHSLPSSTPLGAVSGDARAIF
ncbi:MAG: helix-turn-helix domain-containing protein [Longimicrobiales bacterium]